MSRRRSNPNVERRLQRGPAPRWRGNRVFYVAVEGERTEPDYLSYLNREFGREHQFFLHPLHRPNGMTPSEVVARVLEEHGGDDQSQHWAVFDRDQHPDIPQAFRDARRYGVRVAFSHPSFDLWLLLHFIPVAEQQHGSSQWIHEKLRQQHGFERFGSASGTRRSRKRASSHSRASTKWRPSAPDASSMTARGAAAARRPVTRRCAIHRGAIPRPMCGACWPSWAS